MSAVTSKKAQCEVLGLAQAAARVRWEAGSGDSRADLSPSQEGSGEGDCHQMYMGLDC